MDKMTYIQLDQIQASIEETKQDVKYIATQLTRLIEAIEDEGTDEDAEDEQSDEDLEKEKRMNESERKFRKQGLIKDPVIKTGIKEKEMKLGGE